MELGLHGALRPLHLALRLLLLPVTRLYPWWLIRGLRELDCAGLLPQPLPLAVQQGLARQLGRWLGGGRLSPLGRPLPSRHYLMLLCTRGLGGAAEICLFDGPAFLPYSPDSANHEPPKGTGGFPLGLALNLHDRKPDAVERHAEPSSTQAYDRRYLSVRCATSSQREKSARNAAV